MKYKVVVSLILISILTIFPLLIYSYPAFISEEYNNNNINIDSNLSSSIPIYDSQNMDDDFRYVYNMSHTDYMTTRPDYWSIKSKLKYDSDINIAYEEGKFVHKFYENGDNNSLKINYKKIFLFDENGDLVEIYNGDLEFRTNNIPGVIEDYNRYDKSKKIPRYIYNNTIKNQVYKQKQSGNYRSRNKYIKKNISYRFINNNHYIISGSTCGNLNSGYGFRYKSNMTNYGGYNNNTMKYIENTNLNEYLLTHNFEYTDDNKYDYSITDNGYYKSGNNYLHYFDVRGGFSYKSHNNSDIIKSSNLSIGYKKKTKSKSTNITGIKLIDNTLLPNIKYSKKSIIPTIWDKKERINLRVRSDKSDININKSKQDWTTESISCFNKNQKNVKYPMIIE